MGRGGVESEAAIRIAIEQAQKEVFFRMKTSEESLFQKRRFNSSGKELPRGSGRGGCLCETKKEELRLSAKKAIMTRSNPAGGD